MTEEMKKLVERIEAAGEPSDALDLAIAEWCYANGAVAGVNYDPQMWIIRHGGEFTRSIDTALSLVPEGWAWCLYSDGPTYRASAEMGLHPVGGTMLNPLVSVDAETPALALCAAALRARATP